MTEPQLKLAELKWEFTHRTKMFKVDEAASDMIFEGSTDVIKNPSLCFWFFLCVDFILRLALPRGKKGNL